MSSSPTTHAPYPVRVLLAAAATVALSFGGLTFASAASVDECVPSKADNATTYIVHAAVTKDHPAVLAVTAVPAKWWNWSPNQDQRPFEGKPSYPTDARGTWQGPHIEGGPDQELTGTFNSSNGDSGNASWFHRTAAVEGVEGTDAWTETITEARTETVVTNYSEVTCPEPTEKRTTEPTTESTTEPTEERTQPPAVVLRADELAVTPPVVVPPV